MAAVRCTTVTLAKWLRDTAGGLQVMNQGGDWGLLAPAATVTAWRIQSHAQAVRRIHR